MKAIILAAGRGNRLEPYTKDRPKSLTELAGTTLIERQLALLRAGGIKDIVIVTGYRGEMLVFPGTQQVRNPDWETTNMVESLFCAENHFGDDVIVSYGDIVYERKVLNALQNAPHAVSVAVDLNWRRYWEARYDDPLDDLESLRLDERDRILDIGQPVTEIDDIHGRYIGLLRFRGSGIDALRDARAGMKRKNHPSTESKAWRQAYMTDLLMEMIRLNVEVYAVPVKGGWLEIDTVTDLKRTQAMFTDGTINRFFNPAEGA